MREPPKWMLYEAQVCLARQVPERAPAGVRRRIADCATPTTFDASQYSPTLADNRHANTNVTAAPIYAAERVDPGMAFAATPASVAAVAATIASGRERSAAQRNRIPFPKPCEVA